MIAPALEVLAPNNIAVPTPGCVAVVQAVMLWPDDESARRHWYDAFLIGQAEAADLDREPPAAWRAMLEAYRRDPPRMATLRVKAQKQIALGQAFGFETVTAIDAALDGSFDRSLSKSRRDYSTEAAEQGAKISEITLEHLAARFRPVAHLWAADYWRRGPGGAQGTFPCEPGDLATFLADSEQFLEWGCEHKADKRSTKTILSLNDARRPAPDVRRLLPAPSVARLV